MPKGTVRSFNKQKGFGFIAPDDGSKDLFVHIRAVERAGMHDLREGQRLEFEIELDRQAGRQAASKLKDLAEDHSSKRQ